MSDSIEKLEWRVIGLLNTGANVLTAQAEVWTRANLSGGLSYLLRGGAAVGEATGTAGILGTGIGAGTGIVYGALLGLYSIGRANEIGQEIGERNAWKTGYARTMAALARGQNWFPSNPVYLNSEIRGKNHAIRIVRKINPDLRAVFLERWSPANGGFNRALSDLGGYEV